MQEEKTIQSKQCKHCEKVFDITNKDLEFYDKISPSFVGQKFVIPSPTLCPDCRQRRRLSFRNERKLYRRKCDATGKDIISIYKPGSEYKVYDQKVRWSDDRDPMEYGFNFDFGKTFAENFGELMKKVPRMSLINDDGVISQNCSYNNDFGYGKDCYMCFEMGDAKGCIYCNKCSFGENLVDCTQVSGNSKYSYECIDSHNIYNCFYVKNSYDSQNCYFSENLNACQFCYLCVGLENQKFYFLNKCYEEVEYNNLLNRFNTNIEYKNECFNVFKELINNNKYIKQKNSENCKGVGIINCKNIVGNYITNSENCKYCINSDEVKDCNDIQGWKCSLCYESIIPDLSYNNISTIYCWESSYIYYSDSCFGSSNLFGCVGLRNKQYCIFNKQYSKEEYEVMVAKIISHMISTGEWGEFFDPSLSPFGYNETVANEYYPAQVIANEMKQSIVDYHVASAPRDNDGIDLAKFGYKWSDYEASVPQVAKSINGADLPDSIEDIKDDILQTAIICEVSNKPFRIIPQELAFYRKHNIGLPRRHPDQRHLDRMKLRI